MSVRLYRLNDAGGLPVPFNARRYIHLCDEHAGLLASRVTIIKDKWSPTYRCDGCIAEQVHPVLRAMVPTSWDRIRSEAGDDQ